MEKSQEATRVRPKVKPGRTKDTSPEASLRKKRMVRFFDYNLLTILISLICF